ncbi:MAG: EAL domain-containing protein [Pseudomonadota bacterium]|nr:EAL domain-containing protein [Pseudomonadota bacterium]
MYIGPLLIVIGGLLGLALFSIDILSACRAYTGGESLWSKGQKRSIVYLQRYAESADPNDFEIYQAALAIPLGYRQMRLELEKPEPDLQVAQNGYLQGGSHADDFPSVVRLFRYFHRTPLMADILEVWREGDQYILNIQAIGKQIHHLVTVQGTTGEELSTHVAQLSQINEILHPLEIRFSNLLGEISRFAGVLLSVSLVTVTSLLLLIALRFSWRSLSKSDAAEAIIRAEKERAQFTLAAITDGVIRTNGVGYIEYMNPAAEQLAAITHENARLNPASEVIKLVDSETREELNLPGIRLSGGSPKPTRLGDNTTMMRPDGSTLAVEGWVMTLCDEQNIATGQVLVLHDATAEREAAARLTFQACHDGLTGLLNRREFESRVESALRSIQKTGKPHAILYIDLDGFKAINDGHGHFAGDQLLKQVSAVLASRLRESDSLARIGGDEFGVLLENCRQANAQRIAEDLRKAVRNFRFSWNDKTLCVQASIGLIPITEDAGSTSDILRAADEAMYLAKDSGRDRIHIGEIRQTRNRTLKGDMAWAKRIRTALDENGFVLHGQQIRSTQAATAEHPHHLEVLVRMVDHKNRLVPPRVFLPAAQRQNLACDIDRWVIQAALNRYARLTRTSAHGAPSTQRWFINLSDCALADPELTKFIRRAFNDSRVPFEAFCFEITENSAITNLNDAHAFASAVKQLGCHVALNHFGSGVSSFGNLKNLPVDYVKIEGELVKDMVSSAMDRAMVESIHHVARVAGIQSIAPCVENRQVLQRLRCLGVDYVQGIGISRPAPLPNPQLDMASA